MVPRLCETMMMCVCSGRPRAERPEEEPADPAGELLPGRTGGQIGPVELVKIGSHATWERCAWDAFARGDAAQFEGSRADVGLAPDLAWMRQVVRGDDRVGFPRRFHEGFYRIHGTLLAHAVDHDDGLHVGMGRAGGRRLRGMGRA